jgi:hypothetical protein
MLRIRLSQQDHINRREHPAGKQRQSRTG